MPAVLVHGVPETPALWDGAHQPSVAHGHRHARAARLHQRPSRRAWARRWTTTPRGSSPSSRPIGEPVDLVGHDWGGGFTVRVVSLRPDLVRSWVSDAAGLADVDFEWHDFAKIWQTPGEGEAFWEGMLAVSPRRPLAVRSWRRGVPEAEAIKAAEAITPSMASCILDLYRSATKVQDAWGPDFVDIPKPGMVIVPSDDAFLNADGARRSAQAGGRADRGARRGRSLVDAPGPGSRGPRPRAVLGQRLSQAPRRSGASRPAATTSATAGAWIAAPVSNAALQRHDRADRADRRPADDLTDRVGLAHRRQRRRPHLGFDQRDDPRAVERALQRPRSVRTGGSRSSRPRSHRRDRRSRGRRPAPPSATATMRVSVASLVISLTRRRAIVDSSTPRISDTTFRIPNHVRSDHPPNDGKCTSFEVLRLPQPVERLARRAGEHRREHQQHERAAAADRAEAVARGRAQRSPGLPFARRHAREAGLGHDEDQPHTERDLQHAARRRSAPTARCARARSR